MDNFALRLKELRLLAKAEELEEQAEYLQNKARQYRVEVSMLLCNLPQTQEIETEIDIKQGISEQSKKWEDGCNVYNQEHINKLAEEIKSKQEELRDCDEISNIVSSGYKAL